ncbi:MAG: thiamine biosynthesis protein ThiS [Candidatus Muiribacterium halophilum]|uniref:Thiamine biosynthesis protein ThiS n=1 Tax=Muiribacterium halophilum TaxID=2053465 RepID=A0A2N5ZFZ5_MUIH1|nr:MAG: thiamine biosynthesis protein ThiS [Candidatus Muirbacterium halophilum]
MKIILNSEKLDIKEGSTIEDLVRQTDFHGKPLVVKLNGKMVEYNSFSETVLKDDDRLKVFNFVGGG